MSFNYAVHAFCKGAIMTKGVCMLGKLNYYLGRQASDDGRISMFPEIGKCICPCFHLLSLTPTLSHLLSLPCTLDFCKNPQAICQSVKDHPTIVWDIAFFEWSERIQTFDNGNFNYIEKLHQFVEGKSIEVSKKNRF